MNDRIINFDNSLATNSNQSIQDLNLTKSDQDEKLFQNHSYNSKYLNSGGYMPSDAYEDYNEPSIPYNELLRRGSRDSAQRSLSDRFFSSNSIPAARNQDRWSFHEPNYEYFNYNYPSNTTYDIPQEQDIYPEDLGSTAFPSPTRFNTRLQPVLSTSQSSQTTAEDDNSLSFDSLLPPRLRRSPEYLSPISPNLNSNSYHSTFNSSRASQVFSYLNPVPSPGGNDYYSSQSNQRTMSVPAFISSSRYSLRPTRPVHSMVLDRSSQHLYGNDIYNDVHGDVYDQTYYNSNSSTPGVSVNQKSIRLNTHIPEVSSTLGTPSLSQNSSGPHSSPLGGMINEQSTLPYPSSSNNTTFNPISSQSPSVSPTLSSNKEKHVVVIPKWIPNNRNVCKTLQDLLDRADESMMNILLSDILAHLFEVMMDPFGNYFFQKFAKKCNDDVITQLYDRCKPNLLKICYDNQGSRCIQILIERTKTDYQRQIMLDAVIPDVANMSINTHANHVIQHILQYFPYENVLPIIKDLQTSLPYLSSAKYGCYVLQKAFSVSPPEEQAIFIQALLPSTLDTVNDAYGNYVVQHFIENCSTEYAHLICEQLLGHIVDLSCRKMSSNVVESCLKRADLQDIHIKIVQEFCQCPDLPRLRKPGYASFVINRILKMNDSVSKPLKDILMIQNETIPSSNPPSQFS